VFALNNHAFAAASELEVDAAIRLASAPLLYGITLLAISLADQEFKVRPFHLPKRSRAPTPGKEEAIPLSLANTDQAGGQNGDCWPVGDCWKEGCKGGSHQ
jgi:hypothetical protein